MGKALNRFLQELFIINIAYNFRFTNPLILISEEMGERKVGSVGVIDMEGWLDPNSCYLVNVEIRIQWRFSHSIVLLRPIKLFHPSILSWFQYQWQFLIIILTLEQEKKNEMCNSSREKKSHSFLILLQMFWWLISLLRKTSFRINTHACYSQWSYLIRILVITALRKLIIATNIKYL